MASSLDFVDYICDQLSGLGNIAYKKMFGDYCIYYNNKVIGLVCDNQFFVKITNAGEQINPNLQKAPPYQNAKMHYVVENVEDKNLLCEFIKATYDELIKNK